LSCTVCSESFVHESLLVLHCQKKEKPKRKGKEKRKKKKKNLDHLIFRNHMFALVKFAFFCSAEFCGDCVGNHLSTMFGSPSSGTSPVDYISPKREHGYVCNPWCRVRLGSQLCPPFFSGYVPALINFSFFFFSFCFSFFKHSIVLHRSALAVTPPI